MCCLDVSHIFSKKQFPNYGSTRSTAVEKRQQWKRKLMCTRTDIYIWYLYIYIYIYIYIQQILVHYALCHVFIAQSLLPTIVRTRAVIKELISAHLFHSSRRFKESKGVKIDRTSPTATNNHTIIQRYLSLLSILLPSKVFIVPNFNPQLQTTRAICFHD
jgi:hypothetical protein